MDADEAGKQVSLISWNSKKQACVALSTAEADYIASGHACAQSIWLKHQLMDYGVKLEKVPLYCDNTSAVNLTKIQSIIIKLNTFKSGIIS